MIQKLYKKYKKKKNQKKLGRMVAPVQFDPKILLKGSAKLRWVGRGKGPHISLPLCPVERKKPWMWAAQVR
jgi:hypothetical protein